MSNKKFVFDKKKIVNLFNQNKFNKISKYSKSIFDYYKTDVDICKLVIASEINLKNYFKAEQYLKKIVINNSTDDDDTTSRQQSSSQTKTFHSIAYSSSNRTPRNK